MSLGFIDRPEGGERAVVVAVDLGPPDPPWHEEFLALAAAAGAEVVARLDVARRQPDPAFFIGRGKVDELAERVAAEDAELVLVDRPLSPAQARNLERAVKTRVLDRTGLILDIFAQRARSFEGKLQVELAQLQHLATRLVRGWTHLERQRGGIGLRGPGETQLETDRRLVAARIALLKARLRKLEARREATRRARRRQALPTVTLVGYTNAGKSTLFNRLTGAGVVARDQLFATLDPTARRLDLPGVGPVLFADTVGFVRDLPHELIAAFHSTLQEAREAQLLLHVIDAADPEHLLRQRQVEAVLDEIGAGGVPQLRVYNKIDRVPERAAGPLDDTDRAVAVSARRGDGLDALLAAVGRRLAGITASGWLRLAPTEGRLRAALYRRAEVLEERSGSDGGCFLHLRAAPALLRELGVDPAALGPPPAAPVAARG